VSLAAYLAPPRPTWSVFLGDWSLDPLFVVTVVAGVVYAMGVRRLHERGRRWPPARSAAFAGGLFLIALATQSGLAQYDRTLFSLHVVQHMLLGMVAPLLLVLGAPVTLALQACHRPAQRRLLRTLHSRPLTLLTHPAVVWVLFGGTLVALYFTGLYELSLRNDAVHALVHAHFVVVGFLFMGYVVGIDSFAHGFGYGARLLYVLVLLPFHAFIGVALLGSDRVLASDWYSQVVRARCRDPVGSRRARRRGRAGDRPLPVDAPRGAGRSTPRPAPRRRTGCRAPLDSRTWSFGSAS
jgi:cytochrome c oxidase assembly factor CtaG